MSKVPESLGIGVAREPIKKSRACIATMRMAIRISAEVLDPPAYVDGEYLGSWVCLCFLIFGL